MRDGVTDRPDSSSSSGVSLILSINDLEAEAIAAFAHTPERGWDVVDLGLDWGAVAPFDIVIDDLASTVLLIETPSAPLEAQIRASGRRLHVIDHHLTLAADGRVVDRRSPLSSLEQIAALAGAPTLDAEGQAIAANDRGFYMGLLRHFTNRGLTLEEAWRQTVEIRNKEIDFRCRLRGGMAAVDEAKHRLEGAIAGTDAGRAQWLRPGTKKPEHAALLLLRAPLRLAPVLADAIYRREFVQRLEAERSKAQKEGKAPRLDEVLPRALEFLILYEQDNPANQHPVALEWSAGRERAKLVDDLLGIGCEDMGDRHDINALSIAAGTSDVSSFFRAEAPPDIIDRLADRILDETLTGARPLRYWRSQFYQVLSWDTQNKTPAMTEQAAELLEPCAAEPQERAYFFSQLQPYLTPRKQDAGGADKRDKSIPVPKEGLPVSGVELSLLSWRLKGLRDRDGTNQLRLRIWPARKKAAGDDSSHRQGSEQGGAPESLYDLPIVDVQVHIAFNGIVILEWVFEDAPFSTQNVDRDNGKPPPPWWRILLDHPPQAGPSGIGTMARLLDFNAIARNCFSPYESSEITDIELEATIAGKCETRRLALGKAVQEAPGNPTGWFGLLVEKTLGPLGFAAEDLTIRLDERARLVGSTICAGTGPKLSSGLERESIVLARLTGVDAFDEKHLYDADFAQQELASFRYTRFDAAGCKYSASSHSFTLLGYGGFARRMAAPHHMRTMYRRMFLVILMHGGVLDTLSHAIADCTAERLRLKAKPDDIQQASADREEADREELDKKLDRLTKRVSDLRWRLTAYINALWYEDLSPQIQGRGIFALMLRHSPLIASHKEVMKELERSDDLERRAKEERDAARNLGLEELALSFAIFLGVVTVAGVVNPDGNNWLPWILFGLASGFLGAAAHRARCVDKNLCAAKKLLVGDTWRWLRRLFR